MVSAWAKMSFDMFSRPEKHRKEPATLGQRTNLHSWRELPGVLGEFPKSLDFWRCFSSPITLPSKNDKAAASRGRVLHLHCPSARKPYAGDEGT